MRHIAGFRALPLLALTGCFIVRGTDPAPVVPPQAPSHTVLTRVKAHLINGATVIYPRGVTIERDSVFGTGTRYNLALSDSAPVATLPLDSVAAMETFHPAVRPAETILVSSLATVGALGLAVAIACAADPKCFGSCPTIYSDSGGTSVLEAEGFSYSIAPLYERRDVDRLRAQPVDGAIRLDVRNEALETHFINHLEVLAARHAPDEWVTADHDGRVVAIRNAVAPRAARDRSGRNVLPDIAAHDGRVFQTAGKTLARARPADLDDWIDLEVPVAAGTDSVALAFRMRNSLLATILLYEMMLSDRGAPALDWMARDLTQIGPAVEVAQWAVEHLGMRVQVWDGRQYVPSGRIGDAGPVAWKDVAIVVPTRGQSVARIRLRFPADNWRIDHLAIASDWRRVPVTTLPLTQVFNAAGAPDTALLAALRAPDERYAESSMGRWLRAEFALPAGGSLATYFLASQGYYIEWLRREWLAGRGVTTFAAGPSTLYEAMQRWRGSQEDTERRFYATRVPVR